MALIPFVVMLAIHKALNLSNSMLGVKVGERHPTPAETYYNLLMVLVFYLGILGYVAHAAILAERGVVWLLLKLVALALGWYAFLTWGPILLD
jgi:hypothetical protein